MKRSIFLCIAYSNAIFGGIFVVFLWQVATKEIIPTNEHWIFMGGILIVAVLVSCLSERLKSWYET